MIRKTSFLLIAVAMTGIVSACADNDAEYVELDRTWDSADSMFWVDYNAVRAANERMEQDFKALPASSDSAAAARYAQSQQRMAANRQALLDMEARRTEARAARDAARAARNRAAYDSARMMSDYQTWQSELGRIRNEQTELEGTIKVGNKTVGAVDVNTKDTSKPLLRVEPGKNDDKPLIELNKNP